MKQTGRSKQTARTKKSNAKQIGRTLQIRRLKKLGTDQTARTNKWASVNKSSTKQTTIRLKHVKNPTIQHDLKNHKYHQTTKQRNKKTRTENLKSDAKRRRRTKPRRINKPEKLKQNGVQEA